MAGKAWQRSHVLLAALALVGVLLGVLAMRKPSPSDEPDALEIETVAAPEDLLCDVYITSPNATWGRLQRSVGGAVGILPSTLPGILLSLTEVDARLANEVDGRSPMYGALAGDPSDPAVALAMRLADPPRTRALLTGGDGARYSAEDAGGVTALVPLRPSAGIPVELAMTPNGYLLVTRSAADRDRLGPYVWSTLPARPLPKEDAVIDVPRKALEARIKPKLDALWEDGRAFLLAEDARARSERGRAPDFGEPAAIVAAVDAIFARGAAVLGDLERVRVALDVTDDAVVVTAKLEPRGGDGPASAWLSSMRSGDASELLALPASSALAFSTRAGEAERAEQGTAANDTIASIFGPRLADKELLGRVISGATKARDESFALALGAAPNGGWLLRAPVRDEAAADEALRGAVDLARGSPLRELLRLRSIRSRVEEVPGLGDVSVASLERESDGKAAAPPNPFGLAWTFERDGAKAALVLSAATDPLAALEAGARPDRKLADEPALARFTAAIGSDATTILVAQPLRLDAKRAALPAAPMAIALGGREGSAFLHIDIAANLLREAARWKIGF